MREIAGNLWDFHRAGHYVVITTNGFVKKSGECVMGRGVALEAKMRFPKLPRELGRRLRVNGNIPYDFAEYRILTFPVKHNWWEPADLTLIEESAVSIAEYVPINPPRELYMVRPGCGNGGLDWETQVRPLISEIFVSDRFIIVQN